MRFLTTRAPLAARNAAIRVGCDRLATQIANSLGSNSAKLSLGQAAQAVKSTTVEKVPWLQSKQQALAAKLDLGEVALANLTHTCGIMGLSTPNPEHGVQFDPKADYDDHVERLREFVTGKMAVRQSMPSNFDYSRFMARPSSNILEVDLHGMSQVGATNGWWRSAVLVVSGERTANLPSFFEVLFPNLALFALKFSLMDRQVRLSRRPNAPGGLIDVNVEYLDGPRVFDRQKYTFYQDTAVDLRSVTEIAGRPIAKQRTRITIVPSASEPLKLILTHPAGLSARKPKMTSRHPTMKVMGLRPPPGLFPGLAPA